MTFAFKSFLFTGKDYKYSKLNSEINKNEETEETTLNLHVNDGESLSNSDSEDNVTVFEARSSIEKRSKKDKHHLTTFTKQIGTTQNVEVYEIDLIDADGPQNLQSIALKYNCSVWELKRVNNLVNDQDFHALRSIRIMAMTNSYRSELLQRHGRLVDNTITNTVVEGAGDETDDVTDKETNQQVPRLISIRRTISQDPEMGSAFLRSMDSDLQRLRLTVANHKSSLDEVVSSLHENRFTPLRPIRQSASLFCIQTANDDGTMSWMTNRSLVILLCLVLVVLPLILLIGYLNKFHFSTSKIPSTHPPPS